MAFISRDAIEHDALFQSAVTTFLSTGNGSKVSDLSLFIGDESMLGRWKQFSAYFSSRPTFLKQACLLLAYSG